MSILQKTLNQLETQLRALIEGSAEKLFPSNINEDLAHHMVSAMREEIKPGPDGSKFAPNIYSLLLPPQQAGILQENQALLNELALSLEEYAQQAGLLMEGTPIIKIVPDNSASSNDLRVLASFSKLHLGETSQIKITPYNDSSALPREAFLIVNGTHIVPLDRTVFNIGRGDDNDLVIGDLHISRQHAQLRAIRGAYTIFDLNSSGGTYVNGTRVQQHVLSPGDLISLAGVPLIYGQEQPARIEETQDVNALDYSEDKDRDN